MVEQEKVDICFEIVLHMNCNARCLFCSQDHDHRKLSKIPKSEDIYRRILYWARKWYWLLWFTWWDPLIHPKLFEYIKFAQKAWFIYIRLQTNWILLEDLSFVKKCIKSWVTHFKLSIHHYTPKVHDYLVWVPWAFWMSLQWIKNIRQLWWRIEMNIVITKSNYKSLLEYILYFRKYWITKFVLIFPLYENSMNKEASTIWVKFTDVREALIKTFQFSEHIWLTKLLLMNYPICLLPWYEDYIINTFNFSTVAGVSGSKIVLDNNKAFGKERIKLCKWCEYSQTCHGVDKNYLTIHGNSEFLNKGVELKKKYSFRDLTVNNILTEDEICFLEILKKQEMVSIDDIVKIKNEIQICKDCDSLNKILSTAELLIRKDLIFKKYDGNRVLFMKK